MTAKLDMYRKGVVKKVDGKLCLSVNDENYFIHTWDIEKYKFLKPGYLVEGLIFQYQANYTRGKKIHGFVYPGALNILEPEDDSQ